MSIDGSELRQVLFPPKDEAENVARWRPGWHADDIHPCYLPDGRIIYQGNYNGAYRPPMNLGSPTSLLIALLTQRDHPKNTQDDHTSLLTDMELMRLTRWVDSNYQYYGSYFGRYHAQWAAADPPQPRLPTGRFPAQSNLRRSHQLPGAAMASLNPGSFALLAGRWRATGLVVMGGRCLVGPFGAERSRPRRCGAAA